MGFNLTILIVKPSEWQPYIFHTPRGKEHLAKASCKIWQIDTILRIGRVSAPVNDSGFHDRGARERAALYFTDGMLSQLFTSVKEAGKSCFAPAWTILPIKKERYEDTISQWQEKFRRSNKTEGEFVEPLSSGSRYSQVPSQRTMEEHNELSSKLQKHEGDLVLDRPLVWFDVRAVISWINDTQAPKYFTKFADADPEGKAYLTMWTSCLKAMETLDRKCVFLFEDVGPANFV